MSLQSTSPAGWWPRIAGFLALTLLIAGASESFASGGEQRITQSGGAASSDGANASDAALAESEEEHQAGLMKDGARIAPSAKPAAQAAAAYSGFWIYDAESELRQDIDGDGYYHYLKVRFDADTDFGSARVFARLYLSLEGGPWNLYFTTSDFTIFGTSGTDDYEVASELVSGYPAGLYDVLIELYDADFGDLVAEFGPIETSALSLLPLEDRNRDADVVVPSPPVTRSSGGGGAMTWWMLVLLAPALRRRLRRS